jgi:hypothetical protein
VGDVPQHQRGARAVERRESVQRRGVAQAHAGHQQREHARQGEREHACEREQQWCPNGGSHLGVRG